MTWKELKKLADEKAARMEELPDDFMKQVYKAQSQLYGQLLNFVDDFDTEDGVLLNNTNNVRKISKLDNLWNDYQQTVIYSVIAALITDVQETIKINTVYYRTMLQFGNDFKVSSAATLSGFSTPYAAGFTNIKSIAATESRIAGFVNARLGLSAEGALVKGGYLYNVYQNTAPLNYCREIMFKGISTGMPVKEFKAALREDVVGLVEDLPNEGQKIVKNGLLAKDLTPLANDVFAKVDRSAAAIVKTDHTLKYFIYGGTIIKTTRPFCKERCNKAYSTEEAKGWADAVPGPIAIDKDTYDALVDMGGINCRHSPLFITSELYEVLKLEGSPLIPA